MKSISIVTGVVVMITSVSALANGPMPATSSPTTTTNSQQIDPVKRQRWVEKRMRHLKRQHEIDTALFAVDANHYPSHERYREFMNNRFEYLVLKGQRKGLSPAELQEFHHLTSQLKYFGTIK